MRSGWRTQLKALGPGVVTGASDDDPSGIATYAQAGAQTRYGTLWTALVSLPLMMAVQEMCDRTALATGRSLGRLVRDKFERRGRIVIGALLISLTCANGLNLAADLMAVGEGMQMIHAGPAAVWCAITGASLSVLLVRKTFDALARVFKWLCLSLFAYVAVLFAVHISWGDLAKGLFGLSAHNDMDSWRMVVAILGTTISPYLFFWQSAHRVEDMRAKPPDVGRAVALRSLGRRRARIEERTSRIDVFVGMAFSQIVMVAIIVATAATLGNHGSTTIGTAADAAKALEPIAGKWSSFLFAAGFIGAGVLAVPVLASSGAAGIAGLRGQEWGLERPVREAPLFYGLVLLATVVGTILSVVLNDPIHLLVLSAFVNGIVAAPFLVVLMLVAGDVRLMGDYRNGRLATVLGWIATGVMTAAAVVGIVQSL